MLHTPTSTQRKRKVKLNDQPVVSLQLGSRGGVYRIYIPHSRDTLTRKTASFHETVFSLTEEIQTRTFSDLGRSELDNKFSVQGKISDVAFPG